MNSSNSRLGDVWIQQQNALQAETRGRKAHLERGDQIRSQQSDLAPTETGRESEGVQGVVGGEAVAHGGDRVGNQRERREVSRTAAQLGPCTEKTCR